MQEQTPVYRLREPTLVDAMVFSSELFYVASLAESLGEVDELCLQFGKEVRTLLVGTLLYTNY